MDTASSTTASAFPAALGWRLLAMLYDLLPLLAIWFAVAALVLLLRRGEPVAPGSIAAWMELGLMLLAGFGYFGLSWRRGGQTLGMRAWRLRLVRADGAQAGWSALILRYLVAALSAAALGAGFLWSLLERERRTWHDLASGTVLVRIGKTQRARP